MAKSHFKPLAAAVGVAFLTTAGLSTMAQAENPFSTTDLSAGYNLADKHAEGKCGEGKAEGEGKCGEGKADREGKCGEEGKKDKAAKADGEGKCGEGKCGG